MNRFLQIFITSTITISMFAQSNVSAPMSFRVVKDVIPPILNVVPNSQTFIDENHNGVIDANERCAICFEISNDGEGDAYGCVARVNVTGTTDGITITENTPIPVITHGAKTKMEIPIVTNAETQNGEIEFSIVIEEPNGYGTDPITGKIGTHKLRTPYIQVVSYKLEGVNGGMLNRREKFRLQVIVQNTDQGIAEGVKASLLLSEGVNWTGGDKVHSSIGTLKPQEAKTLEYELMSNAYAADSIKIYIELTESTRKYAKKAEIPLHFGQYMGRTIYMNVKRNEDEYTSPKVLFNPITEERYIVTKKLVGDDGKNMVIPKPICKILSPLSGSTYSKDTITLRYFVDIPYDNQYAAHFYVNKNKVSPIIVHHGGDKGAQVEEGIEVKIPLGNEFGQEILITLQVEDLYNQMSNLEFITLKYQSEKKPTLHIFAVGISEYPVGDLENLNYGAKDAQDFVNTINSLDLSKYKEVKQTLMLNQSASANNVRTQLNKLTNTVEQEDVVMLFFSGHGINEDDRWYFMTYGIPANDYVNALDFAFIRDQMKRMSKNKNCHVLIFMDACHSGGMMQKGDVKDITFSEASINGFYSSAASKKSKEGKENGIFTHALVDGIKGAADYDKGGEISISELREYIDNTLKEEGQAPVFDNPGGDYILFYNKR